MTMPPGRLAEEEFAFRYLSPAQATAAPRELDAVERLFQFTPPAGDPACEADLEPLFRRLVLGQPVAGDTRTRVLAALLQVHLPGCVTPLTGYGLHASYPSPRAYYPMQFLLEDDGAGCLWHVDMRALGLRRVAARPKAAPAAQDAPFALQVRTDFRVYAPLYNLFRKSLFALECGHFLAEYARVAGSLGMRVAPVVTAAAVRLELHGAPDADTPADLGRHRRFARERNSGRFFHGFFPAPSGFAQRHLDRLRDAIGAALAGARDLFPDGLPAAIVPKLCLRAGPGIAPGIYRVGQDALTQIAQDDPIDACERFYNYTSFNFRFVPAILYWCVDELAFAGDDAAFLRLNLVLGYLNQHLIHAMFDGELLGRPFRSYDQPGIDRLLGNAGDGLRAYYGLMLVRNRCSDALGTLR